MEFDWDTQKAESNCKKYHVSFQEAATVFGDPLAITYEDPDHSTSESRSVTFGMSRFSRYLVVSHTEREGKMRIISASAMTKIERKLYEKG